MAGVTRIFRRGLLRAGRLGWLLSAPWNPSRLRSTAGRGQFDDFGLRGVVSAHGRKALDGTSSARLQLVPRAKPTPASTLQRRHRRLPRWTAQGPGQREPRRRIDPVVSARIVRDAIRPARRHRRPNPAGDPIMIGGRGYPTLFRRLDKNPILTSADWPYPVHSVFNPGAVRLNEGTTLLLCRVEDRRGHSHLCAARSPNGV